MATPKITPLNLNEFCAAVSVTQKTARRWLRLGLVKGIQTANGRWKISPAEAERVNRRNGPLLPSGHSLNQPLNTISKELKR
jgi:hypothetical protein